jgi:hypothetical protein
VARHSAAPLQAQHSQPQPQPQLQPPTLAAQLAGGRVLGCEGLRLRAALPARHAARPCRPAQHAPHHVLRVGGAPRARPHRLALVRAAAPHVPRRPQLVHVHLERLGQVVVLCLHGGALAQLQLRDLLADHLEPVAAGRGGGAGAGGGQVQGGGRCRGGPCKFHARGGVRGWGGDGGWRAPQLQVGGSGCHKSPRSTGRPAPPAAARTRHSQPGRRSTARRLPPRPRCPLPLSLPHPTTTTTRYASPGAGMRAQAQAGTRSTCPPRP